MKKGKLKKNSEQFLEGKFISKEKGYGFVELNEVLKEKLNSDIFISKDNNKLNALDGDTV